MERHAETTIARGASPDQRCEFWVISPPLTDAEISVSPSQALLSSMLLLARDYLDRGSAKQAESMLRQAQGLAEAIRSDIWKARSACLLGDIYSTQHRFKDASAQIESALSVLSGLAGGDSLEISRVKAMLQVRTDNDSDAQETFTAIIRLLEDCETSLGLSDKIVGT